jgi:K+-transporting ATPase ATPase C chain
MDHTEDHSKESRTSFLFTIVRLSVLFIVLCGIAYPLACTVLAQLLFLENANGSLIKDSSGQIIGSEQIGQSFSELKHFHGRVSSIGYDGAGSGSENFAPSNPDLLKRMQESIAEWKKNNPDVPISRVPIALLTNSGSGLDPHITPESAKVQIPRISKVTGLSADRLEQLVDDHVEGRGLGIFGEPRVNVLKLNIALDELLKK